uniref:Pco111461 n=1 Tax=Arundo donax TaxID=35708 RepID=A0A0A9EQ24_ARUDO
MGSGTTLTVSTLLPSTSQSFTSQLSLTP